MLTCANPGEMVVTYGLSVEKCWDVNYYNENDSKKDATYPSSVEGREGVKWELGFAYFSTGKMGFEALRLGFGDWDWDWNNISVQW